MNVLREDPPPTAISGHVLQLNEIHRVVIHIRDGAYWVADLRGDEGELTDMATWSRLIPAALRSHRGRAAALADIKPLTPELIERLEALHQRGTGAKGGREPSCIS